MAEPNAEKSQIKPTTNLEMSSILYAVRFIFLPKRSKATV
jgi:hypothetical protein